ncbi:MAG: pyrimidine/purine nucleoside phosphorylase [Leadbetterella sp.]
MISVNEYFDGNVKSLGYETTTGKATVGVMEEGTYVFNTGAPERMTVVQGELLAKMAGETDFTSYKGGSSFEIAGNSSFEVTSIGQSSYLCEFL